MVSSRGLIDDHEDGVKLGLFVQLHSLRSISCQYVRGNFNAVCEKVEPWIDDPERLSDITSLDFSKCALEKSDLVPIFESIKTLRTFNYEYARPEELSNATIDPETRKPGQIVQSLLARFSGSLVTLEMTTANTKVRHSSFEAVWIFVGDLRSFQGLKS